MRQVGIRLVVILLCASVAEAKQDVKPRRAFFHEKRVDFWRDGSADPKPASNADTNVAESLWVEPIRLPDGRYTTYVPPRPVLEFLENPTRENARKYLEWQSQRMEKMRRAAALLSDVHRSREAKVTKPETVPTAPVVITYFKKAG